MNENGITLKDLVTKMYEFKKPEDRDFEFFYSYYLDNLIEHAKERNQNWDENTFINGKYLVYVYGWHDGYSGICEFDSAEEIEDFLKSNAYNQKYYRSDHIPIINGELKDFEFKTEVTLYWK
ncbi:hypothetical protein D3C75_410780 [compost metagenome]